MVQDKRTKELLLEVTDKLKELCVLLLEVNPKEEEHSNEEILKQENNIEKLRNIREKFKYPFIENFQILFHDKYKEQPYTEQYYNYILTKKSYNLLARYNVDIPTVFLNKDNLYLGDNEIYKNKMTSFSKVAPLIYKEENHIYDLNNILDFFELAKKYPYVFLDDLDFYDYEQTFPPLSYREGRTTKNIHWLFQQYLEHGKIDISNLVNYFYLYKSLLENYHFLLNSSYIVKDLKGKYKSLLPALPNVFFTFNEKWETYFYQHIGEKGSLSEYATLNVEQWNQLMNKNSNTHILVPWADIKNKFQKEVESNIGYLKIGKNIPLMILPINMTQKDIQWLKEIVENEKDILLKCISMYAVDFDDLFFSSLLYNLEDDKTLKIDVEKSEQNPIKKTIATYNSMYFILQKYISVFLNRELIIRDMEHGLYILFESKEVCEEFWTYLMQLMNKYENILNCLGEKGKKYKENIMFYHNHYFEPFITNKKDKHTRKLAKN